MNTFGTLSSCSNHLYSNIAMVDSGPDGTVAWALEHSPLGFYCIGVSVLFPRLECFTEPLGSIPQRRAMSLPDCFKWRFSTTGLYGNGGAHCSQDEEPWKQRCLYAMQSSNQRKGDMGNFYISSRELSSTASRVPVYVVNPR